MKNIIFILTLLLIHSSAISQQTWTKHPVPVLTRSATFPDWKGLATADAFVMNDNDTLKMWYSGSGWLSAGDDCPHVRMGYAWSLDGITWNEYAGNPVLDISSDTSDFDADGIETPTVIKDTNAPASERYKLWYAGRKTRCQPINDHKFGYAYSPDGIHWTKYAGNPVMQAGTSSDWYNVFLSSPCVIKENNVYKMWFGAPDSYPNNQATDGKGNIGYAESFDGISWLIYSSPVLIAGDQMNWDSAAVSEPSVMKVGNTYHMFYSALDSWTNETFQVGYAWSNDGINWTKSSQNPVLSIGAPTQWDRFWASHPAVIYDSTTTTFRMWYTGRDTAMISSLQGYYWDLGYAESDFTSGTTEHFAQHTLLSVYPNPSNEYLVISLDGETRNPVMIYNSIGELVLEKDVVNSMHIDVSGWACGIYNIRIGNESTIFVKQ